MSDNAQTLHHDVHLNSFLLYSISLYLKVEDAKGREDGVEHYGNGKQSYAVQKDSQATFAIPSMPVRKLFSLLELLFETEMCAI